MRRVNNLISLLGFHADLGGEVIVLERDVRLVSAHAIWAFTRRTHTERLPAKANDGNK